jgi:hypothetical protein
MANHRRYPGQHDLVGGYGLLFPSDPDITVSALAVPSRRAYLARSLQGQRGPCVGRREVSPPDRTELHPQQGPGNRKANCRFP